MYPSLKYCVYMSLRWVTAIPLLFLRSVREKDLLQNYRCWSGTLETNRGEPVGAVSWATFRGRNNHPVRALVFTLFTQLPSTWRMMAERGLSLDHPTFCRWVQRYAPILNEPIRRELRGRNHSWRVDETYIRVAGSGHIYTERSILKARPLTSCCRPIVT
jgi:hypothetical protein